ncbi:MAG: PQQ-binding-like beta-propeller repeat protein [Myxococcota bacterium]
MANAHLMLICSLAGGLPSQTAVSEKGWVKPPKEVLRVLFKPEYKRDLGEFELLKSNEEEWTAPLISRDGQRLYVGTRVGRLQALDVATGNLIWQRLDMGTIGVGLAEFENVLVVGSDSDIVGLDLANGKDRWKIGINGRIGGQIAVEGNLAIVPVRPNAFVAVDLSTGEQKWRVQRQTPDSITVRGQATPTIDVARGQAYLGFSDGALVAVDLEDGGGKWVAQLGKQREFFADVDAAPILVDGGKTLVAASYNGGFARFDPSSGDVALKKSDAVRFVGLSPPEKGVIVASHGDGQIMGIYASSGKVRWRYRMKNGAPTAPILLGDGHVLIGAAAGPLSVLRVSDGFPIQVINLSSGVSVPPAYRAPHMAAMTNTGLLLVFRQTAKSS